VIYLATERGSGSNVILKHINTNRSNVRELAMREIKLLQGLRHKNVVNIFESAVSHGHVDIVLEYCRGGDLWNYVKSRAGRPLPESQVLTCFHDACSAVAHMHSKKIAHWDIKMDNILRASDGTFKLCDFGSCQRSRLPCEKRSDYNKVEELVQKYTSPIYRAPEMIVILNNSIGVYELTEKVDVWALGCVLYSLAYFVRGVLRLLRVLMSSNAECEKNSHPCHFLISLTRNNTTRTSRKTLTPNQRSNTGTSLCTEYEFRYFRCKI
jgi:serine/threonine protein kinase